MSTSSRPLRSLAVLAPVLVAAALLGPSRPAQAEVPKLNFGTAVPLACKGSSGAQDVGKTMTLENTTKATIPKGRAISWEATDGDKGSLVLQADLPAGGTVTATGGPKGASYTCAAKFTSNPDLVVKLAAWQSPTQVLLNIGNTDSWIGAGASVTRVEVVACSGGVIQSVESPLGALGAASTAGVGVAITRAPKSFLRVTVDSKQQVLERNETNNTWDDMDTCVK